MAGVKEVCDERETTTQVMAGKCDRNRNMSRQNICEKRNDNTNPRQNIVSVKHRPIVGKCLFLTIIIKHLCIETLYDCESKFS